MSEPGGGSVFFSMSRVAVLEQDGVPLPGPKNLYVTNAAVELKWTPVYYKGADIQQPNGNGDLCLVYKGQDSLVRFDLGLTICTLDPELENILVGGETFTSGGQTIGGAVPAVGTVGAPFGVSYEAWSKHIVNGDQDGVWPWIHWIIPRGYFQPDANTLNNGPTSRAFTGYTSQNPNWFNGPANDWNFPSDRSIAWAYSKTIPPAVIGAQQLVGS